MFVIWKLNPPVVTCRRWDHPLESFGVPCSISDVGPFKTVFPSCRHQKATSPPPEAKSDLEDQGVQKVIDTKK